MSIQQNVAYDEVNRDSYAQLGPKLKYKQVVKSLNKCSSTRIGMKYLGRNDDACLNQDSSFENPNDQPVMRSEAARRIMKQSHMAKPEPRSSKSIQPTSIKEFEKMCTNVYSKGQESLTKAKDMRRSSNHNQNEVSFGYQSMQPSFHKTAVTQFHQKEISFDRPPRSNFAKRLVSSEAHDPENVPTQHTATSIISREPPRRMDFSHQQPLMASDMHVLNLTSKPSFTRVLPQ